MSPLSRKSAATAAALLLSSGLAQAQETTLPTTPYPEPPPPACPTVLTPPYAPPVPAEGWKAQLIATGLSRPRSVLFDSDGGLLVLEAGRGLTRLVFDDHGGTCLTLRENQTVIDNPALNHGLQLSEDGRTLYVSTDENVHRYSYDAAAAAASDLTTLVGGMAHEGWGHVTRTLLLSRKQPDLLLVSRGSGPNIDELALDVETGVSQIRAFNISAAATAGRAEPYDYPSDGVLVGWGLRNSVGVDEDPGTGGIWSVENSADNMFRLGVDIHEDNPGEELNYHGTLAPGAENPWLGANYGYPDCYALWNTTDFPELGDMTVGDQFSITNDEEANDAVCAAETVSPRLTFRAHMAPLDITFDPRTRAGGRVRRAFVSFHGSWNRDHPAGYKLSYVEFDAASGQPLEPADSLTAARDVLAAPDVSVCGQFGACMRPVGITFDAAGERMFVTSDSTGEIWVVMQEGDADGQEEGGGDDECEDPAATTKSARSETGGTITGGTESGAAHRGVAGPGWMVVAVSVLMAAAGTATFMA